MRSKKVTFEQVNAAARSNFESLLRQWMPHGKKSGAEYFAVNSTRNDSHAGSFTVNTVTGVWKDFATEDGGSDPVSLYAYLFHGNKQGAAVKELGELLSVSTDSQKITPSKKRAAELVVMLPPLDATEPPKAHKFRGLPEAVWCYRSEEGATLGYVYRFKTSDGGKVTIPLTWCRNSKTGFEGWHWKGFEIPRPLYGLWRLAAKPDATVLIVEGEKCADVAEQHLQDLVCLTWPNGSKAVDKANWVPLAGRKVIVWPDCDGQFNKAGVLLPENEQPGVLAAGKVAEKLVGLGCKVWIVNTPKPGTKKSGWDIADLVEEGLTGTDLSAWLGANVRTFTPECIHDGANGHDANAARHKRADTDDWEGKLLSHVLHWNKTHASVVIGGKHRIMRFVDVGDSPERSAFYEFFSRSDLSLLHDNKVIQTGFDRYGNPAYRNHLMAWAKHSQARAYTGGVVFLPGRIAPKNCFNTWQGFSVVPKQNDALLERIYAHILNVICGGKEELNAYVLNWVARSFQCPDQPSGSVLVMRGEKGAGKGVIGHFLRAIWGRHAAHISDPKHLVGSFNGHLANTCLLFCDEAYFSGDKQHEGRLKALVTEPVLTIEQKGIDAVQQPNYLKIIMSTNLEFAVPASKDERRFCVLDVSQSRRGDYVYFDDLLVDCKSEEVQAAFLYAMLHRDLTSWRWNDIPESEGLRAQRYHSFDSVQRWLVDSLHRGSFAMFGDSWETDKKTADLFDSYVAWCSTAKTSEHRILTQCLFGRYLGKLYKRKQIGGSRVVSYVLGTLQEAIKAFEDYEKVSFSELSPDPDED